MWIKQCHRDDKGVRWREGKDLSPGAIRLVTPYDVQARHSIKRGTGWTGYKVHFSETGEPDAPHMITNVATTAATVTDTEMTAPIHQALQQRRLLPDEHLVDHGYTSATLLAQGRTEYGLNLVRAVRIDVSRQRRQTPEVAQDAFTIDWDARRVTCPQGHTSAVWSAQRHNVRGVPIVQVFFRRTGCEPCPLRQACTRTPVPAGVVASSFWLVSSKKHRTHGDENRTPRSSRLATGSGRAWKEPSPRQCRSGIRTSRYIGLPETHLGQQLPRHSEPDPRRQLISVSGGTRPARGPRSPLALSSTVIQEDNRRRRMSVASAPVERVLCD
ncbi:transposase [Nonomuraea sp. NPDC050451]|uniref:transposase n=1 Tax=Nonomuraea sp. NPDC050451 TaxID=3364364 RepID=UPI0037B12832